MSVWPFPPIIPFTETNEWKTDVIRTKSAEQRFALRPYPRIVYQFRHQLTNYEYQSARSLVRADNPIKVPDWMNAVYIGAIAPGSNESALFDNTDINYRVGDFVMIWETNENYEECSVVSQDSNGVFFSAVTGNYSKAYVVPLHTADHVDGLNPSRPAGPRVDCRIDFIFSYPLDLSASTYSTYRSHDVVTDCPVVASGSFDEKIIYERELIDNQVGNAKFRNLRSVTDEQFIMSWLTTSKSELNKLRFFIHSRKGKQKSFWLSSFGKDFELAQNIGASDVVIVVFASAKVTDIGKTGFDIEIKSAGTLYRRQVDSWQAGSEINGRPTIELTITASLGIAVNAGQIDRISFLRCIRFDQDRIQFNHISKNRCSVSVNCIEVLP